MSRNNTILAILGGAAVAALIANYLSTENGKQMLQTASDKLKDFTQKASDYAKNNLGALKTTEADQVQPS